jgi:hypothetical protein
MGFFNLPSFLLKECIMASTKKSAAKKGANQERANAGRAPRQDRNGDGRVGRGPAIPRETEAGKPTAYGVMKALWTARGEVRAKGLPKKFEIEDGPINKSWAINILKDMDKDAEAPFTLGPRQTLVPVGAPRGRRTAAH